MRRILLIGLMSVIAATANAQLPQIRVTGLFPAGAQVGKTLDVLVTAGSDLDEASELIFTHPGIKATPKLNANGVALANRFVVSIDNTVKPGLYDARLRGLYGISNPRIFRVDSLAEIEEKEPNNTPDTAQEIALNTIVNARSVSTGDVDQFKLTVKANQTIVIRSEAAILESLMQPALELFNSEGRRLTHSRRRNQQDATIVYTSTTNQTLSLKVHDTLYAGSQSYIYRLSIDTRPLVDYVSPPVATLDADTAVAVYGRHLPAGQPTELKLHGMPLLKQDVTVKLSSADQQTIGTDSTSTSINSVLYSGIDGNLLSFAISDAVIPTTVEHAAAEPQTVTLPALVTGTFAEEFDEDTFRFEAKEGDKWQIDVMAHRLGSVADPLLTVEKITTAEDGTETAKRLGRVAENKQNPGGNILPTLTSDPSFLVAADADGIYQVRLADRFAASRGNPALHYTLTIQKPVADFQLVTLESFASTDGKLPPTLGAVSLRKGGTYQLPVYAYRTGGHKAAIQLRVEGLPKGVTCNEATIRAGATSTLLVLSVASNVEELVAPIRIIGSSVDGEQKTEHAAKIATLAHAGINGLPRTGRVSGSLVISVMKDEEPFHLLPEVVSADVSQDQQLLIPLKLTRLAGFDAKVAVTFAGQPKNVDVPAVSIEKGVGDAVARFYFKENVAPGPATLLMYATAAVPYRRNPWNAERAKAKVAKAAEKLAAEQKVLTESKAATESAAKKVAELQAALTAYDVELKAAQAAQAKAQASLKTAIAGKAASVKQLLALKEKIGAATAGVEADGADLDAALKAVHEATAAVQEASKPVQELIARIATSKAAIATTTKQQADKNAQIAAAKADMVKHQQAMEIAKAAVTAAEAKLKAAEAAKKAADDVSKKAEAAAKAKNINVRTIALPVQLNVHKTPGKIAAAVPGGGAIKKGATAEVKVTLTRKNKFAGSVKVSLALPAGVASVTSNTINIAADATEGTLTLTAAADAAPATIANAVIRATAEFQGRQASFDVPVTLKVTE